MLTNFTGRAPMSERKYLFSGIPRSRFELLTILYGIIAVNIFDGIFPRIPGYHLLLLVVYVAPYIPLVIEKKMDIKNIIWLGILISLLNDIFFVFIVNALGVRNYDFVWYYLNWLIPQNTYIGYRDILIVRFDTYSWMMAISIYARIAFLVATKTWRPESQIHKQ